MSLLPVGFGASGDDYEITDSLRLRSSASAYLTRTFSTPTDNKKWTFSFWFKRGALGTVQTILSSTLSGNEDQIYFPGSADTFRFYIDGGIGDAQTVAVFRDPSAWYHMIVVCDTANATATDRAIIYVNGVRQTVTGTNFPLNAVPDINGARLHYFGRYQSGAYYTDGYLTEVNFIDGQALTPTDFGEYDANGTWKAKDYTGTYGNNGFYLPMKPTTQAELQNTVLYSGTAATQSIDGCGYAPDLVWLKSRNAAYSNALFDSVRGVSKWLSSNGNNAEAAVSGVTSFDSDGFTLGADTGQNNSGTSYVAWTWDAGDNQPSTGHSSITFRGTQAELKLNGFGFSPDLIWMKSRSNVGNHGIWDSVRGATNVLKPNLTDAESSVSGVISFDADGYTLGSSYNANGGIYIAWGWDAGDGDPVSNTDGSITSTVKANPATGFSVVTYTGDGGADTIGHGLGVAPKFIITKTRSIVNAWNCYHASLGAGAKIFLSGTNASTASSTVWNNTSPTSTVFSVGDANTNGSGTTMVAYCFSEVSGVSKFDSYTGTGSAGNSVTTGFRPGFVMIKNASASTSWNIIDSTRSPFSTTGNGQFQNRLFPNLTNAESTDADVIEFTDTGFVINITSSSQFNNSGNTYIYMAFKGSYSDYVSPLNTTGTTDSRVKANPSKGFSIVSYTGTGVNATVGHGLGVAPSMVIVKSRSAAIDWNVYHVSQNANPASGALTLNSTAAFVSDNTYWNGPTGTFSSTVFSVGSGAANNSNTNTFIAYCFSEVAGYSKFGSYTGTGVAGNSVTGLGFQPAWLMIKCSSTASTPWVMYDNTREPDNDNNDLVLQADNSSAELDGGGTTRAVTFDSDGFTLDTTYGGNNGSGRTYIYMAFADTRDAVFNFDASGNKNNWLPNNINSNAESETTYDLMKDTPSLVDENAANFATWNPLRKGANVAVSEGNLKAITSATVAQSVAGTIGMSSGKWYWEVINQGGNLSYTGIVDSTHDMGTYIGSSSTGSGYAYNTSGQKVGPTSGTAVSYGASYTTNDVIGIALDMDAGTLVFYKNGVSQGTAFSNITGTWFAAVSGNGVAGKGGIVNFGQRPFTYTPPTGFLKLNTFNLPDSTIEKGDDYFNTVTFSGNGSGASVTGVNFQPDFIWAKNRTNAYNHELWDAIRGVNSELQSNSTAAEITDINRLVSFDSDGFSYGTSSNLYVNGTNSVAWNWKANGSGVSNNVGDTPSTVSANTTAGFSIVSFTAPSGTGNFSAGHGLGVTPAMVIVKTRDSGSAPWYTWHNTFSNLTNDYVRLNATSAKQTQSSGWGAGMTSSVIGLRAGYTTVGTEDHIAYCFAEVEGYSSIGSYTGNGSTDGPFIFTGFRPSFLLVKNATVANSWRLWDNERPGYNLTNLYLSPDTSGAEGAINIDVDFLSNGFKIRNTNSGINGSGNNIIYMAFAENPFKNANAR